MDSASPKNKYNIVLKQQDQIFGGIYLGAFTLTGEGRLELDTTSPNYAEQMSVLNNVVVGMRLTLVELDGTIVFTGGTVMGIQNEFQAGERPRFFLRF